MKVADRPCMLLPGGPQNCSSPQGQVLNSTHLFQYTQSLFTCGVIRVTAFCLWSSETADTAFPFNIASSSSHRPLYWANTCSGCLLAASWYDVGMPKGVQTYRQEFSLYTQKETGAGPIVVPSSCWELLSPIPRLKVWLMPTFCPLPHPQFPRSDFEELKLLFSSLSLFFFFFHLKSNGLWAFTTAVCFHP